jgi:hypothetical protein
MGVWEVARDNEPGMPKKKRATGGSGKWTEYTKRDNGPGVMWDEVDPKGIVRCVQVVTRGSDAVLFGQSQDGSVLVLTICSGTERIKFYAKDVSEMESHLHNIIAKCEE